MSDFVKIDKGRIHFLSETELDHYFGVPTFGDEEREIYFSLSDEEYKTVDTIKNNKSKIHFILLLGYFKAKTILFNISHFVVNKADVSYIAKQINIDFDYQITISRPARDKHIRLILDITGWRKYYSGKYRDELQKYANTLAQVHTNPIFIFTELSRKIMERQIETPKYYDFQLIISNAIQYEENRLYNQLEPVPVDHKKLIQKLLKKKSSQEEFNLQGIFDPPRSLNNVEIHNEIKRFNTVSGLYYYSIKWIDNVKISEESVRYYAYLVSYYGRGNLTRMKNPLVPLCIMCFVVQRCKQINDNLIDTFHSLVSKYKQLAKELAEGSQENSRESFENNEKKLARVLDLFVNKSKDETTAQKLRERAFKILDSDEINTLIHYMKFHRKDKRIFKWNCLGLMETYFRHNLRPIFKHLIIGFRNHNDLENAALLLLQYLAKEKRENTVSVDKFPIEILSDKVKNLIVVKDKDKLVIDTRKYEFYIYHLIDELLYSGEISSDHSFSYIAYEDEILNDDDLLKDKIDQLDLEILKEPIEDRIDRFKEGLEFQINETNQNILNGKNHAINIKSMKTISWTLPYNKPPILVNHSIYRKLPIIDIADVIKFANDQTNFMSFFTHILNSDSRKSLDKNTLTAVILARASNHGIHQMGRISDFAYDELRNFDNSYLSIEAVRNACNKISNEIRKLAVFNHYNINGCLHGGIDGQKSETKYNCFKARHSPKYFYLGKGISTSTFLINHVPANSLVFGANEHESKFVFDLIYNNETEIQPKVISTDSAGSNCVNFALLNMFGKDFAPCFKQISNKESMVYGFKSEEHYQNNFIIPSGQVDTKLIIEQWPKIKNVIASLALKRSNQNLLVRKLSSSSHLSKENNKLKKAIWEYDKIIRSQYILRYIDDEKLRQSVRTALNRNESYHQLKSAITSIGSNKNSGRNDQNVALNDECARLISEVIIYYNGKILSEIISDSSNNGDLSISKYISKISLVAWTHVNLHGIYKFKDRGNFSINIQNLARTIPADSFKIQEPI